MIESARGAAPFDRGRRAGLKGKSKCDNPFDNPGRQTQSGVTWERKCSEWDEGWSAGNAERLEREKAKELSSVESNSITPKAIEALRHLRGTNRHNTRSAKALASLLWPDRLADCGTSLRRGGLYRSAGAYYSKLAKKGLCDHWMDDFNSGYFITKKGMIVIDAQ